MSVFSYSTFATLYLQQDVYKRQLVSLQAQKAHYESYIKANPEWEYAGLYYDEGISGTKKENRSDLLRMLSDCETGRID